MATAREAVALALEAHELHLAPNVLQRGEELLGLLDAAAQILLAVNDQQRGLHILHVLDGRHVHILIEAFPGRGIQFVIGEGPAKIAGTKHRSHVAHTAIGHRHLETVIMTNEPVGHKAAIAATGDAHTLLVDVAPLQQSINALHDIDGVFFAPGAAYRVGKIEAVATTAAWVGIEYDVSLRYQHLHLMKETVAVLRIGSTVDLDNQWILLRGIEVMRLEYPAIHRPTIRARV